MDMTKILRDLQLIALDIAKLYVELYPWHQEAVKAENNYPHPSEILFKKIFRVLGDIDILNRSLVTPDFYLSCNN